MTLLPLIQPIESVISFIQEIISEKIAKKVLFNGELNDNHKTKFFFQKLTDQYESSIKTINRTFVLNVVILPFVIYPLLAYPPGANFKIPLIDFEIKNSLWIQIAPAITLFIQLFFLTSLIWFQIIRRGIFLILSDLEKISDDFGDIRNISLSGIAGIFHLLFSIRKTYTSRFHLIWYLPFFILALGISLTPLFLSGFLIFTVFKNGHIELGIIYLICSLPVCILVILLIGIFMILLTPDWYHKTTKIDIRIETKKY